MGCAHCLVEISWNLQDVLNISVDSPCRPAVRSRLCCIVICCALLRCVVMRNAAAETNRKKIGRCRPRYALDPVWSCPLPTPFPSLSRLIFSATRCARNTPWIFPLQTEHFQYHRSNNAVAASTLDLFISNVPTSFQWAARWAVYALMDPFLLKIMGLPQVRNFVYINSAAQEGVGRGGAGGERGERKDMSRHVSNVSGVTVGTNCAFSSCRRRPLHGESPLTVVSFTSSF